MSESVNPNPSSQDIGAVFKSIPQLSRLENRLTGGPESLSSELLDLRTKILREADVMRVLDLKPHPRRAGKFLYLIETNFQFPRFVIGETDADLNAPLPLHKCGTEWAAVEIWNNPQIETP